MIQAEKIAIVSVSKKDGVDEVMKGLAAREHHLYATSGTADMYHRKTGGEPVDLLSSLVGGAIVHNSDREMTAQILSGRIKLGQVSVRVACLNLRPPKLEVVSGITVMNLDLGGISMITASGMSGALVLTDSEIYDEALYQLDRANGVQPAFMRKRQIAAHEHIMDHYEEANKLAA